MRRCSARDVAPGGHLILAGILERQTDELRAAYAPWLLLDVHDREDGWVLMVGQRDTADSPRRAMSLATRCVACGTVFRVVQDQLKVSEGWVRCGRCGDVFNALEGLFDLERETAPAWTPSQRGALDLLPAGVDERNAKTAVSAALTAADDNATDAGNAADDTELDTRADSQLETRLLDRDDLEDDAVGRGEVSDFDATAGDDHRAAAATPDPAPAFLRQADTAARWQRPRVRLA